MICPHWQYFITLDSDLNKVSRYVDIKADNFSTFSIQFVRLLFAASSEVDVVAKLLCKKIDSSKNYKTILDYRATITEQFPQYHSMIIDIPRYEIQLTPWENWGHDLNPYWWNAYNNVKHHRNSHFQDATLENTINAVAGLFIMIWYLHHEDPQRKKQNKPVLFSANRYIDGFEWANTYHYKIPEENVNK